MRLVTVHATIITNFPVKSTLKAAFVSFFFLVAAQFTFDHYFLSHHTQGSQTIIIGDRFLSPAYRADT